VKQEMAVGRYDRVFVASGALGVPVIPKLPGLEGFKGTTLYSRAYKG
jgi:cation diffusion facilitator CzcD-associated flavoprotein CzcO